VLRRRRGVALLLRRAALIGIGVITGARLRRLRRRSAAEYRLAEVAEKAPLPLMLFRGFVGRRLERMLLNERGLGENIGRLGGRADGVVDEGLRFRVARRRAVRVDALE